MREQFVKEQLAILNSTAEQLFIAGGRQGGKTWALSRRICIDMAKTPGFKVLYTAKSDMQCCDMYRRVLDCGISKRNLKVAHSGSHKEIWYTNGSYAFFNSTREPKNLKGPTYDLTVWDEIQDSISKDDYEDVAPALVLARQGKEIFSGQPRTVHHWFFRKYIEGIPKGVLDPYSNKVGLGLPECETIVFPTPKGLPYQGEKGRARLAKLKAGLSLEYRWYRDYICNWVGNDEDKAFREEDVLACVHGVPMPYNARHQYVVTHDLGWMKDNAVVIVYDMTVDAVVFCKCFKRMHPDRQTDEVMAIRKLYPRSMYVVDATGGGNPGQPINYAKRIQARMPDVHFHYFDPNSKPDQVIRLKEMIDGHMFRIPECYSDLIDELCLYECHMKGERIVYHAPEETGMHDDHVMALVMVFEGIRKWGAPQEAPSIPRLVNR